MEKRFYCVIPFSPLELGIGAAAKQNFNKEYVFSRAKVALYPKRDHLLRLLSKMGLASGVVQSEGLTTLFYHLFNPSLSDQRLNNVKNYLRPVVLS